MRDTVLGLVVVLIAASLAFVVSDYRLFQLTTMTIYAIAILGLALVTGYNGQISLGHGAFYAVGAYVTAILISLYDVPYWATLPVSAAACAGIGFLVGLPALRLGWPVSRADHLRARGGDAAIAQAQGARALDRRRPGHRGRQAGSRRSGCRSMRTSGSICSAWRSRPCCSG